MRILLLFMKDEQLRGKLSYENSSSHQELLWNITFRSSRPEVFCKKGVLRNFAKFTGKHLCQSFCFSKVACLCLLKKRLRHRCFPLNFAKLLRIPFLQNPSGGYFYTLKMREYFNFSQLQDYFWESFSFGFYECYGRKTGSTQAK